MGFVVVVGGGKRNGKITSYKLKGNVFQMKHS